jgi:hypothetical protein
MPISERSRLSTSWVQASWSAASRTASAPPSTVSSSAATLLKTPQRVTRAERYGAFVSRGQLGVNPAQVLGVDGDAALIGLTRPGDDTQAQLLHTCSCSGADILYRPDYAALTGSCGTQRWVERSLNFEHRDTPVRGVARTPPIPTRRFAPNGAAATCASRWRQASGGGGMTVEAIFSTGRRWRSIRGKGTEVGGGGRHLRVGATRNRGSWFDSVD